MATMGWPTYPELAAAAGTNELDMDEETVNLVWNNFHVACITVVQAVALACAKRI